MEERNKAMILKANEELLNKGNTAFADEAFEADYTFPGYQEKGPALIKAFVNDLKKAFPDLQYKVDLVTTEGNMVAWRRTHTATHKADYLGYKATGKSLTWQEYGITRFSDNGKISEEWGASDFDINIQRASGVEGVYEYFGETKGMTILRNGQFIFLNGPSNGSQPIIGQGGTYTIEGDKIVHTFRFSTNPKLVGTSFYWKVKSWSGDTVSFATYDTKGSPTGEGRALRVSY